MSTTQKPASSQANERKPTSPQHDDPRKQPGQAKPTTPQREEHRDRDRGNERNAPHKK